MFRTKYLDQWALINLFFDYLIVILFDSDWKSCYQCMILYNVFF